MCSLNLCSHEAIVLSGNVGSRPQQMRTQMGLLSSKVAILVVGFKHVFFP